MEISDLSYGNLTSNLLKPYAKRAPTDICAFSKVVP